MKRCKLDNPKFGSCNVKGLEWQQDNEVPVSLIAESCENYNTTTG